MAGQMTLGFKCGVSHLRWMQTMPNAFKWRRWTVSRHLPHIVRVYDRTFSLLRERLHQGAMGIGLHSVSVEPHEKEILIHILTIGRISG